MSQAPEAEPQLLKQLACVSDPGNEDEERLWCRAYAMDRHWKGWKG